MKEIENSQLYYNLAEDNLLKVDFEGVEIDSKLLNAKNKSIAILVDHEFLPTPLTVVSLDLYVADDVVGMYQIYIDEENIIVDDMLNLY